MTTVLRKQLESVRDACNFIGRVEEAAAIVKAIQIISNLEAANSALWTRINDLEREKKSSDR